MHMHDSSLGEANVPVSIGRSIVDIEVKRTTVSVIIRVTANNSKKAIIKPSYETV